MKSVITHKVSALLKRGIQSEAEALYLLVEIRKLLETDGIMDKHQKLIMYADLVAHPKLKKGWPEHVKMLKAFEDWWDGRESSIDSYCNLDELKSSLAQLATDLGMYQNLLRDEEMWKRFVTFYCCVIKDCPIRPEKLKSSIVSIQLSEVFEYGSIAGKRNLWGVRLVWSVVHQSGEGRLATIRIGPSFGRSLRTERKER